jgi:hypothetical protein
MSKIRVVKHCVLSLSLKSHYGEVHMRVAEASCQQTHEWWDCNLMRTFELALKFLTHGKREKKELSGYILE